MASSKKSRTQVYLGPSVVQEKKALDFRITLNDLSNPVVLLSTNGGKLNFPVISSFENKFRFPPKIIDTTKNAMRTYVIPLTAFVKSGDFVSLKTIKFIISDGTLKSNGDSSAVIYLDSLAFWA